jgi:hypothetical protein
VETEDDDDEEYNYTDDETYDDEEVEVDKPEPMSFADQYVPHAPEPCKLEVPMKAEEYAVLGTVERTKLGYP